MIERFGDMGSNESAEFFHIIDISGIGLHLSGDFNNEGVVMSVVIFIATGSKYV